jgi:predicted transcriptional regulator
MPRQPSEHPTELELLILKLLWERSPQTARQIRERLEESGRELAHTSVITTLLKMVDKGQLQQLEAIEGKAFRFAPLIKGEEVSMRMLADLVERVFDGSAEKVLLTLFDVSDLDEDAVKRMRRALNQKMREQQS